MELKPYHVGIIERGCSHCGTGKVFAVLDDDGADILGMSWTDDEDSAQEMCDAMNVAYTNGYAQGNVNTRPAPSEEAVEDLIQAYRRTLHATGITDRDEAEAAYKQARARVLRGE